jgi:hypothetical protein
METPLLRGRSVTRTAFRYPRTLLLNKEFAPAL